MGASGTPDWYKIQVSHEGIMVFFKIGFQSWKESDFHEIIAHVLF